MPRSAIVLNALIASPSDVSDERDTLTRVMYEWNAVQSRSTGIVLEPVRWETHSFPASGDRPQALVDKQIVDNADFVIGIFGYRLGTPTGEAQSGTIEEIERLRKHGKHVSLYFSNAPIPRSADRGQLKALEEYQQARQKDSLYFEFGTPDELGRLVSRHLPAIVEEVYRRLKESGELRRLEEASARTAQEQLSELAAEAKEPLRAPPVNDPTVTAEVDGEFPDGPYLHVMTDEEVAVVQLDYLDENGAKLESDRLDLFSQDFRIPIDNRKITTINNLKRANGRPFSIQFRMHMLFKGKRIVHSMPALVEPSYKTINGTTTYFMKVRG